MKDTLGEKLPTRDPIEECDTCSSSSSLAQGVKLPMRDPHRIEECDTCSSSSSLTQGASDEGSAPTEHDVWTGWEWPNWCLDCSRTPAIEVYVLDDSTGKGEWYRGEPCSRVVNKHGQDTHLSCEYIWDNKESYVQDFGPHEVRKSGSYLTVMDLYDSVHRAIYDARDDCPKLDSKGGSVVAPLKKVGWGHKISLVLPPPP